MKSCVISTVALGGTLVLVGVSSSCTSRVGSMSGAISQSNDPASAWDESLDLPLAFVGMEVFDGSAFEPDSSTVLVEQGKITYVGGATTLPANTVVIEGNYTLLPGFIDLHVHLGFYDPETVLKGGITTARDLGWPPDMIFPLSDQLDQMITEGPHLLAAGPMLTAVGGYPSNASWAPEGTALELDSASGAAEAVRTLAVQGAAVIKVAQSQSGPTLSLEILEAIVAEAHQQGLRVTSHVGSLEQLEVSLAAGVDELAHGLWSDEVIPESSLQQLAAAEVTWIPTLHIDPSEERLAQVRQILLLGGRVLYGTDMGNSGPPPGIDTMEISLLIECGMTLDEALAAATSEAAAYLDLGDRGRIAPGYDADLVLVEGDPRDDLSVLSRPVMVWRAGTLIE